MPTVLVVEDDSFISSTYNSKLTKEGFTSIQAPTTQAAKQALEDNEVDFILLDVMLPDESGLTFLRELRKEDKYRSIPVMILSNVDSEETMAKGERLGVVDYMVKVEKTPAEIVQKIKEYLDQ